MKNSNLNTPILADFDDCVILMSRDPFMNEIKFVLTNRSEFALAEEYMLYRTFITMNEHVYDSMFYNMIREEHEVTKHELNRRFNSLYFRIHRNILLQPEEDMSSEIEGVIRDYDCYQVPDDEDMKNLLYILTFLLSDDCNISLNKQQLLAINEFSLATSYLMSQPTKKDTTTNIPKNCTFEPGTIVKIIMTNCDRFERNYTLVKWPENLQIPASLNPQEDSKYQYIGGCFTDGLINLDGEYTDRPGGNVDMIDACIASHNEELEFYYKFIKSKYFDSCDDLQYLKKLIKSYQKIITPFIPNQLK